MNNAERIKRLEWEIFELRKALINSNVALDTWINTYADDMCDRDHVLMAYKRIEAAGGTLAFIADTVETNRKVLEKYEPKSGYYCLEDDNNTAIASK